MAKNRNKKKKTGVAAMEISSQAEADFPQAMDTTETKAPNPVQGVLSRKIKKAAPLKRSKNRRKIKAMEKAIARSEKSDEKILKGENKMTRTQSAKTLYD